MEIVRTLSSRGDPLAAVRRFLSDLWRHAQIDAMLVQLEPVGEELPATSIIDDPDKLLLADPFLPVVTINTAQMIADAVKQGEVRRMGAVLRPCEAKALRRVAELTTFNPQNWLLIGVDCLGSYPLEDYDWRLENAGEAEQLTRGALRNARQGGISVDRYRPACQMCMTVDIPEVDISIGVLGVPVKEVILVSVKDEETARRIHLDQVTDNPASPALVEQHAHMLELVNERRVRNQARTIADLPPELPDNVEAFMAHLEHCIPCQACLLVCPVYGEDWQPGEDFTTGSPEYWEAVKAWLESCAGCGMCEQACPNHMPLAAIHRRIANQLEQELIQ